MVKAYIDSLSRIYEKINSGDCSGCSNCCSESVGASFVEAEVIFDAIKLMNPKKRKIIIQKMMEYYFDVYDIRQKCPFLNEEKLCEIYEVRPLNCRLYGHWEKADYENNLKRLQVQNIEIARLIKEKYGYKISDNYIGFSIGYCETFKGELLSISKRNELYDELIVLDSQYFVKNKILTAYEDKGIVEHIVEKLLSKERIFDLKINGRLSLNMRKRLIKLAELRIGAVKCQR